MSANVINCYLADIINNDISLNKYCKHAKTATVRPIFKKHDRTNIKNYCPVSLLNIFSKNMRTISARKSHKLRRHNSFKIYSRLSQVL